MMQGTIFRFPHTGAKLTFNGSLKLPAVLLEHHGDEKISKEANPDTSGLIFNVLK